VVVIAPTIDWRLLALLVELDDETRPIAETNRRLGRAADLLGIPRPSYEQVRALVHAIRRARRPQPIRVVKITFLDVQNANHRTRRQRVLEALRQSVTRFRASSAET
jgi:hypothetical protein